MENYFCFYTSQPFWTCEKPDIASLNLNSSAFEAALSERTLEYTDGKTRLVFCKDGLIMTQIEMVEKKMDYFKQLVEEKEPVPPGIQYMALYLDYLNAIQILLASSTIKIMNLSYFNYEHIFSGQAFDMTFDNGKPSNSGVPEGTTEQYFMGRFYSNYVSHRELKFDKRIFLRREISKDVFDSLWEDFKVACSNEESIRMLSLINS
ncbi:MAG: hypothetical protein ACHQII_04315, partial [Bacteroidia bacterium]